MSHPSSAYVSDNEEEDISFRFKCALCQCGFNSSLGFCITDVSQKSKWRDISIEKPTKIQFCSDDCRQTYLERGLKPNDIVLADRRQFPQLEFTDWKRSVRSRPRPVTRCAQRDSKIALPPV